MLMEFSVNDSLKSMDASIKDNTKGLLYWGDLEISKDNLDILRNRIVVLLERNFAFKDLFKQYPYAMATYVVFLAKYRYNGDFWGMIAEEIGIDKPNAADQTQIGKMILKTFDACGLDYSVAAESGRKYVDSVLYEVGIPPYSNFGDLFYIFKYGQMSNTEPQILIDEITSREYGVHKPLLHFLDSASEDRAINFVLDIQDTYIAATQTDDFSNKYSDAFSEWAEQDKLKTTYHKKDSDEQVEVRPYFYFDNGKKGLCIILPRQNMTEEWVESAQWSVTGDGESICKKECFVQGKEGKRFIDQLIIPVMPCKSYSLTFEYNDGFESYPKVYELKGIGEGDFFYFNSNGRRVNQRYLRAPYGIVVYSSDYEIITSNVERDIQVYPLLNNDYRIEQITPLTADAHFTIRTGLEDIILQMRPQLLTTLSGKMLFDSEYVTSEIPLFTDIPKLHLSFEGFNSGEGIELRIGHTTLTIDGLSLDEENVIDIRSGFENKCFGIQTIRIYQFNRFIKQVRFCLLPEFKSNYHGSLEWIGSRGSLKSESSKVVVHKVEGWQIDFANGNVQDLTDKYEVHVPYKEGVLSGTIISQQENLHLAVEFELPICAFKSELVSNNEISERCDLSDFLDGNPWLSVSFYGDYKEKNYLAELISANGVEQKKEIKLSNNGSVNFDLKVFRDTVQAVPLPVKIRVADIDEQNAFDVILIDEVVKFKFRPQYFRKSRCVAIKDEDIKQNATLEKFGEPDFEFLLNYEESTVNEKGVRTYPISEEVNFSSGYYRVVRESNVDDLFALSDDFEVSLQSDQFFVSLRNPQEPITTVGEWVEQFISDLIRNRSMKRLDELKMSESYRLREKITHLSGECLSDNDIANLTLLGNIYSGKIPNAHKDIISDVMISISNEVLSNIDRFRILEQLVKTNSSDAVVNTCKKKYSLMLFEFPDGLTKKYIKELAGALKPISVIFSLQVLMKGNVPIRDTFGVATYRDLVGQDALIEMMCSDESEDDVNEDRKHFLREDGMSHVYIALNSDITGINNFFEMADEKKLRTGRIYLDKKKIPEIGTYFAGLRYTDLFVNWYIRNHLGDTSSDSEIRTTMKNGFDLFKNSVWNKALSFNRNPDIAFFFKDYNTVLLERTTSKGDTSGTSVSQFTFPTFFYFVGIAALIVQLDEFNDLPEIKNVANKFMVNAFQIAPFISERDTLMASMYIYLKRKESR